MFTILGAGLSGLSSSYHLGHARCIIFEQKSHAGGHSFTHNTQSCMWDEGPHVSFTENDYVRKLFEESVNNDFNEFPALISNYYQGHWIPHPAQSNLFAVPKNIRESCWKDFVIARNSVYTDSPKNYHQWLIQAFGHQFTRIFSEPYTKKYWTMTSADMSTDWIGNRVFYPNIKDVFNGLTSQGKELNHYVKNVRYPKNGGYFSYANKMLEGANIKFNHEVEKIDLSQKKILFKNGSEYIYDKLISTIPLPLFVGLAGAPKVILDAADKLNCTSVLLVNVVATHQTKKPYHWTYVYDEKKLSTRINCLELLSRNSVPEGKTGIQVEVYESRHSPLRYSEDEVAEIVCNELIEMGFIDKVESCHTMHIKYANIIFDLQRRNSQDLIFSWLENFGLIRDQEDLDPMTRWSKNSETVNHGDLMLAGRFGQWKYFWSDDCILRGHQIARFFRMT
jgi:protoporphyrinogen oxidase